MHQLTDFCGVGRPRGKWIYTAAMLAMASFLAKAPPALQAQDGGAVFRADTRLVVLHASVVDKNGKYMTNLPRNAFRVYEDGVEQEIKVFRREDVPVSLGIVIDNSGSMRDKRGRVESSAISLVKASNPQDEVFIVNFNDEAFLDVTFTNEIKKLEEGVARIDSRGGTAMRDAISGAIDYLKANGKRDKKVLLVITDGNDNTSEITLERLVQRAQQSEVLIYTIGMLSEEEKREARRAKRALDTLSEATGAAAYYPKKLDDVQRLSLQVAHDLRNQYIIAYSPRNQELDGTFRKVRVTINGPNRPVARTRTGYYAAPAERAETGPSQDSIARAESRPQ